MFQAAACRSTAAPATDSCTLRTTGPSGYGARSFGAPWRRSNNWQLGRPGENLSSWYRYNHRLMLLIWIAWPLFNKPTLASNVIAEPLTQQLIYIKYSNVFTIYEYIYTLKMVCTFYFHYASWIQIYDSSEIETLYHDFVSYIWGMVCASSHGRQFSLKCAEDRDKFGSAFSEVLGTMRMHSFFLFNADNERFWKMAYTCSLLMNKMYTKNADVWNVLWRTMALPKSIGHMTIWCSAPCTQCWQCEITRLSYQHKQRGAMKLN